MKSIRTVQFVFFFFIISKLSLAQSSGSLDLVFSDDGKNTTNFSGNDIAYGMTIDANGRTIVVGNNGSGQVTIARYTTRGELDTDFSGNGKRTETVHTVNGDGNATAYAVAVQEDGKIVVVGTTISTNATLSGETFILRYNADGTPDTTFPGNGKLVEIGASNSFDVFYDVAIDPNQKILVAGTRFSGGTQAVIRRYNSDGSLDLSFYGSTNGVNNYPLATARSMELQSDGKIVIGGTKDNDFFVMRVDTNGDLDTTFDVDGFTTAGIGTSNDIGNALAIDSEGKIILVGSAFSSGFNEVGIAKFNADGSLYTSFDSDGKKIVSIDAGADVANAVGVQPNGDVIIAGTSLTPSFTYIDLQNVTHIVPDNNDFFVLSLSKFGSLNTSFSSDGKVKVAFEEGKQDEANALILQIDGKITIAGKATTTNSDFGICRLHGINGFFTLENKRYVNLQFTENGTVNFAQLSARKVVVQSDEKIIVLAYGITNQAVLALFRFNKNGTLDNTFSGDGKLLLNPLVTFYGNLGLLVQPDGKILLASTSSNDFVVIRLLPNGNFDNSFGINGISVIDIFNSDILKDIKLQSDGKIVLAGESAFYISTSGRSTKADEELKFSVVRLNTDGSLDTSFDSDGKLLISANIGSDVLNSLAIHNGKIIITGFELNQNAIAYRFNADGSPDTSFDTDGKLIYGETESGNPVQILSFSSNVQADGKLLLGIMKSGALSQSYIKRFNLDGSLDNTFQSFISSASSFHYIDKFEVLPNGEIVISEKYNTLSLYSNLMYRLKPDGSYDNSFYFGNYSYQTLGYELINEINYFSDFALGNYSRIYIIGYSDHLEELTLEVFLPCKKPEIEFTIHNSIDEVYNSPFVAQTIKSFSGISDTAIAEFYAVKSVELNPGFEAQSGSVFTAHTGLFCNYTHNPEDLVP